MEPGRGTEGHDSSAGGSKEALEHSLSSLTASMLEEGPVKMMRRLINRGKPPWHPTQGMGPLVEKGTHGIRGRYWKRNGNRRRQR